MQILFFSRPLAGCILLALSFALSATSRAGTFFVTTTNDNAAGCLRYAITNANATVGAHFISFTNLPGTPPFTFTLASALPAISNSLAIDGTTHSNYAGTPIIELNGTNAGAAASGLQLNAGSCAVIGLAINRFSSNGIVLNSAGNVIQGNFIGTDTTGKIVRRNVGSGIWVAGAGNLIGGSNAVERNVVSGNGQVGIALKGSVATGNTIAGNFIGTDITGTNALANSTNGIQIDLAPANVVGPSNVISGNKFYGVYISGSGANSNLVIGNYIGTDVSGRLRLGNTSVGVYLSTGNYNQIGGRNSGNGNVISGNTQNGIYLTGGAVGTLVQGNLIGLSATGTNALANGLDGVTINGSSGNTIGGSASGARNFISGNTNHGVAIVLTNDSLNVVAGNYIGTDISGQRALPNLFSGVYVQGCTNTIGGTKTGNGNVISGNTQFGVYLLGTNGSAKGNLVAGNLIGLDYTGTNSLGNGYAGIGVTGAATNMIGGSSAVTRNIISGNGKNGILMTGAGTTGNVVQGNYIGTDIGGILARGNTNDGINLQGVTGNLIGGTNADETTLDVGNLISGNNANDLGGGNNGVYLTNSHLNLIHGNRIGTDANGTVSIANSWNAIYMEYASSNQIGGSTAGTGNLLSGNGRSGIRMSANFACWRNLIQGNLIGTRIDGSNVLANTWHGIDVDSGSTNNIIGGRLAGEGNTLAYAQTFSGSGYCGVRVRAGAWNNLISGNAILNNNGLGIDLDVYGVTANVACESGVPANAANRGQNYPILSNAAAGTLATVIRGSFDSAPNKTYALEFFASPAGDTLGKGEGQVYLGQTNLTLGGACTTNFTISLPISVPTNWVITATATDPANNTSEFSNWITNIAKIPVPVAALATYTRTAGITLQISITNLATYWTNPSGYPVKLAAINLTTTNGVNLTTINLATNADGSYAIANNSFINYTNTSPNQNDRFSYIISDGYGTNAGWVRILVTGSITGQIQGITYNNGVATTLFSGIPGWTYNVQRATNLVSTNWVLRLTTNAPAGGVFQFADDFSDLGGQVPKAAYYQLFWQP